MGQFLATGIVQKMVVDKKKIMNKNIELDDIVASIEEQLYIPKNLYNITDHDTLWSFDLDEKIFQEELVDFLDVFYSVMYSNHSKYHKCKQFLEELKNSLPSEWMDFAENRKFYLFQSDKYAAPDTIYVPNKFHDILYVYNPNIIMLALEGKILMEEYGLQFTFVKYCMRAVFQKFKLAGALRMYITG